MGYKNFDDVMQHLTRLEKSSDHNPIDKDIFQIQIDTISNMLDLFGVRWHFVEKKDCFIAELI